MSVSGDGVEDQLAIGHDDVTYTLLKSAWRRGPQVDITIQGARYPVQIPAAFLEGSGDNTWTLVLYMLHALVNEEGQVYARAPEGTTLQPVKTEAAPVAGEYLFKPKSTSHFTWTQGPQGARKGKAVIEGEGDERSSISASSSTRTQFREHIIARDGRCLLSSADSTGSQAAHIVPRARIDVYSEALNDPGFIVPFETSMGLLLRNDLHYKYDCYEWSLYMKVCLFREAIDKLWIFSMEKLSVQIASIPNLMQRKGQILACAVGTTDNA
ncbi:MAG: hypothetical protein CYPHOPRED_002893 [Cyphobasidiales sp. Tagirdzhanova-0007]|nr:MAG: hypothetical protein CYPHOPRED_002893 [Cyphobasidiales sp. Tagirdzhanova-0007]